MAILQWGFFSVPHLLWNGASVYNGHLRESEKILVWDEKPQQQQKHKNTNPVGVALRNPHSSKAMSAEHRSKFAVLCQQWWRLHMSEKFISWTKTPTKQNNVYMYMNYILSRSRIVVSWIIFSKNYWKQVLFRKCNHNNALEYKWISYFLFIALPHWKRFVQI